MPSRLDVAYTTTIADVRRKVLAYTAHYWNQQTSYRDEQAALLIAKLVPRIEAGQARIAQLTDAYLSRVVAAQTGKPIRRGTPAPSSTEDLRGVTAAEVYQRPFVTVWSELAAGKQLSDAITAGAARLTDLAATNLQLARTHAARTAFERSGVQQYQRVLTGSKSCALCVVASTQRYYRENLMPIHPGCGCSIAPYDGPDVQVINPGVLARVHGSVAAEFGFPDYSARGVGLDTGRDYQHLIVANDHGEIGPVLGVRGHRFTGPDDLLPH